MSDRVESDRIQTIKWLKLNIFGDSDFVFRFRTDRTIASLSGGAVAGHVFMPSVRDQVENLLLQRHFEFQSVCSKGVYEVFSDHPIEMNLVSGALHSFILDNFTYLNAIEDWIGRIASPVLLCIEKDRIPSPDRFRALLRKQFALNSLFVEYRQHTENDEVPAFICKTFSDPIAESLRRARVIVLDADTPSSRALAKRLNSKFANVYVFPVRSKSFEQINTREVLLAIDNGSSRSTYEIQAIDLCISRYLERRIKHGQKETLYWQNDMLRELLGECRDASENLISEFDEYMNELGHRVVTSTQAHSFAYLRYNHINATLKRAVSVSLDGALATRTMDAEWEDEDVPLKLSGEFLSAWLFENASKSSDGMHYVRNIPSRSGVPETLYRVTCRRNEVIKGLAADHAPTVSEVALLVEDQRFPIGVICMECPYPKGFEADLAYLRQVIQNAGVFWSLLIRASDQLWLRRNLEIQEISHQIEKEVSLVENEEARTSLQNTIRALTHDGSGRGPTEMTDLYRAVDEIILQQTGGSTELAENTIAHQIKVYVQTGLPEISTATLHGTVYILRNLIANRIHSSGGLNTVSIVTRANWHGAQNTLVIRTSLDFSGPQQEIDAAFRRPITRPDNREHVGLFLIGVITRTLGGRLCFDRRPGVSRRKLELCLPLEARHQ
jgi:hypothetical protein